MGHGDTCMAWRYMDNAMGNDDWLPHKTNLTTGALTIPNRRNVVLPASVLPNAILARHHSRPLFPGAPVATTNGQRPSQKAGCFARILHTRQENMTVVLSLQAFFNFYYLLSEADFLSIWARRLQPKNAAFGCEMNRPVFAQQQEQRSFLIIQTSVVLVKRASVPVHGAALNPFGGNRVSEKPQPTASGLVAGAFTVLEEGAAGATLAWNAIPAASSI